MADIQIRAPEAQDLDFAKRLLGDEGLPVEDLTLDYLALSATIDGELSGVIGLEDFNSIGLLRSLVVASSARGTGLGRRLVEALEASVRDRGMQQLWLLTVDADPFFAKLGYERVERDTAPDAIRDTQEFSSLCPGDAVVMRKTL